MKAFIIGDEKNFISTNAVNKCIRSSNIPIEFFQQTSPDTLQEHLREFGPMKWNYPVNDSFGLDRETGIILQPYRTNDVNKVFACTISHARLWQKCVELNEEIMILEHDAIFIKNFKTFDWDGGVLGLNDPRGATFASLKYHNTVSKTKGIQDAPWVANQHEILQGLPGNSAYIIKPAFAEKVLNKLKEKGGWPNDAIMCKQFFPKEIKVIYPYYTQIQKVQSTTTL